MRSIILAVLLIAPRLLFADDHLVGQKVMVIHWESKLTDDDKKLTTPVYLGDIFTVEKVDGRLLWVKQGWLHDSDVLPPDDAIAYFSSRIDADTNNPRFYHDRASAFSGLKRFDEAIADENKDIELSKFAPDWYRAYGYAGRGRIWLDKRSFDLAIIDFDEATKLDPKNPFSYNNRGLAYRYTGKYQQALDDFGKQIELTPDFPHSYGNRAWIFSTCPDSSLRDPDKAIESATRACELSDWHSGGELDTLAAAYASKGDFASAIKWQTKAIELGLETHFVKKSEDLNKRLELYKSGQPYIDKPEN